MTGSNEQPNGARDAEPQATEPLSAAELLALPKVRLNGSDVINPLKLVPRRIEDITAMQSNNDKFQNWLAELKTLVTGLIRRYHPDCPGGSHDLTTRLIPILKLINANTLFANHLLGWFSDLQASSNEQQKSPQRNNPSTSKRSKPFSVDPEPPDPEQPPSPPPSTPEDIAAQAEIAAQKKLRLIFDEIESFFSTHPEPSPQQVQKIMTEFYKAYSVVNNQDFKDNLLRQVKTIFDDFLEQNFIAYREFRQLINLSLRDPAHLFDLLIQCLQMFDQPNIVLQTSSEVRKNQLQEQFEAFMSSQLEEISNLVEREAKSQADQQFLYVADVKSLLHALQRRIISGSIPQYALSIQESAIEYRQQIWKKILALNSSPLADNSQILKPIDTKGDRSYAELDLLCTNIWTSTTLPSLVDLNQLFSYSRKLNADWLRFDNPNSENVLQLGEKIKMAFETWIQLFIEGLENSTESSEQKMKRIAAVIELISQNSVFCLNPLDINNSSAILGQLQTAYAGLLKTELTRMQRTFRFSFTSKPVYDSNQRKQMISDALEAGYLDEVTAHNLEVTYCQDN